MGGRVWVGVLLIVLGLGFFLQQSELWNFEQVLSAWWPLILIVIGMVQLIKRTYSSPITGLILLMAGILFLINQWVDFNAAAFIWPLILILVGIDFLFSRRERKGSEQRYTKKSQHTDQLIKTFSLFSEADVKSRSSDFNGGYVTTLFGEAKVDLLEADFPHEATMDLTSIFGDIDVKVPKNVNVEISGLPVFGEWDNNTRLQDSDGDTAVLKINCLVIFGDVDIKN
ncbi:DUF5668 domain-containing protein [Barrientosiimonas marina]|uniref:LiaI-LiaF-like domain-containing protein n=1 Tax=Lentibacillus kimchii TaxID=1542911 RepID=A0ABW2UV20_9BACI